MPGYPCCCKPQAPDACPCPDVMTLRTANIPDLGLLFQCEDFLGTFELDHHIVRACEWTSPIPGRPAAWFLTRFYDDFEDETVHQLSVYDVDAFGQLTDEQARWVRRTPGDIGCPELTLTQDDWVDISPLSQGGCLDPIDAPDATFEIIPGAL